MLLEELSPKAWQGKRFRISQLQGAAELVHRLEEIGLFPGTEFEVARKLPLRGPWILEAGVTAFSLRENEARALVVEFIS